MPDALAQIKKEGGRRPTSFQSITTSTYVIWLQRIHWWFDRPIPSGSVMFVVADDSIIAEPLCDLLPRLTPDVGAKACSLTGSKPAVSNSRVKELLGWKPIYRSMARRRGRLRSRR